MATYTLISSQVLGASATSVTFSAIPTAYTDLVLRFSVRSSRPANESIMRFRVNGNTTAVYNMNGIIGYGTTILPQRQTNSTSIVNEFNIVGDGTLNNVFSSGELYFGDYTSSASKPISNFNVLENNTTADTNINFSSMLVQDTNPITSIDLSDGFSANFMATSSFNLYGIKNS
tara:strand:- start:2157 stop:2678 length:522 start_codon:yes stop_codon:yes gene_type:complete